MLLPSSDKVWLPLFFTALSTPSVDVESCTDSKLTGVPSELTTAPSGSMTNASGSMTNPSGSMQAGLSDDVDSTEQNYI